MTKLWMEFFNKEHRIRHLAACYSWESVCEGNFIKSIHYGLFKCENKSMRAVIQVCPFTSSSYFRDFTNNIIFQNIFSVCSVKT